MKSKNEMDAKAALLLNDLSPQVSASEHTSTPWKVKGTEHYSSVIGSDGEPVLAYPHDKSTIRANAAFIVLAVNAHEELLKVAKMFKSFIESDYEVTGGIILPGQKSTYDEVCKAIAAAQVKP